MGESLPKSVSISSEVLVQEVAGEVVLLDLRSERYFSLDDVGTQMWRLLAEHGDVATVCVRLLAAYDVDEATLRHDLGTLIGRLAAAGLVEVET